MRCTFNRIVFVDKGDDMFDLFAVVTELLQRFRHSLIDNFNQTAAAEFLIFD